MGIEIGTMTEEERRGAQKAMLGMCAEVLAALSHACLELAWEVTAEAQEEDMPDQKDVEDEELSEEAEEEEATEDGGAKAEEEGEEETEYEEEEEAAEEAEEEPEEEWEEATEEEEEESPFGPPDECPEEEEEKPRRTRRAVTEEDVRHWVELRDSGMSVCEIARAVDRDPSTVLVRLRRYAQEQAEDEAGTVETEGGEE